MQLPTQCVCVLYVRGRGHGLSAVAVAVSGLHPQPRPHSARGADALAKANSPRTDIVFAHSATRINYGQQQQQQQQMKHQQQHGEQQHLKKQQQQQQLQLAQQFGQRHQIIGFWFSLLYCTAHRHSAGQVHRHTVRRILIRRC